MTHLDTLGGIPLEDLAIRLLDPIPEGPEELIPGLIPWGQEVVIAGQTNVGKSLCALEIVSSLVTGEPLWDALQPAKTIKKVLYILAEHHTDVIQKLHRKTQLPMTEQVFVLGPQELGFDKWLVAQGKPNLTAVDKFKRWVDGCDFIVFDPLSAFICGTGELENDNITMRTLLDLMGLVAQSTGASFLVLAHQGKPMMDSFGREQTRRTYAIRGASGTEDTATNIFYLDKSDGPTQNIGDGILLDLKCRKFKGETPPDRKLLRDPETLTHTLLGNKTVFKEVQKFEYRAKIARLREDNPGFDERTAQKVLASVEGMPVETLRKKLGLTLKP